MRNDLDEGGEGCTLFRRSLSGLVTKVGGHGWQGAWKTTDEAGVLSAVADLAEFNRGGHWSTQGSITRGKRRAEEGAAADGGRDPAFSESSRSARGRRC